MSVPKIQHRPLFSSDKCSGTVSIVGPRAVAGAVGSVENPVFQGLGTSPADSTAQTLGCSDPQIPPKTPCLLDNEVCVSFLLDKRCGSGSPSLPTRSWTAI